MTWGIAGIIVAYAVVALLLVNVILCTGWSWHLKVVCTLAVGGLYYVTWLSIPPAVGWPTRQIPPGQFNLLGTHVQEPDKTSGAKGVIYLWVVDINHELGKRLPRAHALTFTPELHTRVTEAGNKLRKRLAQLGEVESGSAAELHDLKTAQQMMHLRFFDMPDPLFPEK
jgi:hypothetical protein